MTRELGKSLSKWEISRTNQGFHGALLRNRKEAYDGQHQIMKNEYDQDRSRSLLEQDCDDCKWYERREIFGQQKTYNRPLEFPELC